MDEMIITHCKDPRAILSLIDFNGFLPISKSWSLGDMISSRTIFFDSVSWSKDTYDSFWDMIL